MKVSICLTCGQPMSNTPGMLYIFRQPDAFLDDILTLRCQDVINVVPGAIPGAIPGGITFSFAPATHPQRAKPTKHRASGQFFYSCQQ